MQNEEVDEAILRRLIAGFLQLEHSRESLGLRHEVRAGYSRSRHRSRGSDASGRRRPRRGRGSWDRRGVCPGCRLLGLLRLGTRARGVLCSRHFTAALAQQDQGKGGLDRGKVELELTELDGLAWGAWLAESWRTGLDGRRAVSNTDRRGKWWMKRDSLTESSNPAGIHLWPKGPRVSI